MAPSRQGNGTTGKRKQFSASHAETKRHTRPEEDHSRIESARSIIGAECRENISAPSRGGDFSLDIPFYRTCPVIRLIKSQEPQNHVVRRSTAANLGRLVTESPNPSVRKDVQD